jgi:hypothetical protein
MTGEWDRRLDWIATVLLALATVATAWSAYQSRTWTGEQSQGYGHATAKRIAVNRTAALANRQVQIDVATFVQWVDARFTATGSWPTSTAPASATSSSPRSPPARDEAVHQQGRAAEPFALPQYRLQASAEADRLDAIAAKDSEQGKSANQRADNYMLAVVLFAAALFFAGISGKLQTRGARVAILGLGCALFLGTVVLIALFPVHAGL